MRRKIQATVVPTDPQQVQRMLRKLGEPVTLFGEREVFTKPVGRLACAVEVYGTVPGE